MPFIGKLRALGSLLTVVAMLGGCATDAVDLEDTGRLTMAEIAGDYSAVTFTTTTNGTTIDRLAEGGTLDLVLQEDGTTEGRLFVPAGAGDGEHIEADLSGTFSFDPTNGEVSFDHAADTFIRNMTLIASRVAGTIELEGERVFGDTTLRLVLK